MTPTPPQDVARRMSDRPGRVLEAVGKRISQSGDMHIRVSRQTVAVLMRAVGLRGWEMGDDQFREIDALALDALRHLALRRIAA